MSSVKRLLGAMAVVFAVLGGCLLYPCTGPEIRESTLRDAALWRIKEIVLAMSNSYAVQHRKLPPRVVCDKHGNPLYSWRVPLLLHLAQGTEHGAIYTQFKLDEPWDSPHNKALLARTPGCYRNPVREDPPGTTSYQVFSGPGTAFERDGMTYEEFVGGASALALVVEAAEPVPWSKPADLTYDPDGPLPALGIGLTAPTARFLCYKIGDTPGFTLGFADASARWLFNTTDEQTLRRLIAPNSARKKDRANAE
jgi:hypothetical protein